MMDTEHLNTWRWELMSSVHSRWCLGRTIMGYLPLVWLCVKSATVPSHWFEAYCYQHSPSVSANTAAICMGMWRDDTRKPYWAVWERDNPALRRPRGQHPHNSSWLRQVDASCWELLGAGRDNAWSETCEAWLLEWCYRVGEVRQHTPSTYVPRAWLVSALPSFFLCFSGFSLFPFLLASYLSLSRCCYILYFDPAFQFLPIFLLPIRVISF